MNKNTERHRTIQTIAALIVAVVGLAFAPQPAAAQCNAPKDAAEELYAVLTTGSPLEACNWRARVDPSFNSWRGDTENLPVLAAAVALYYQPLIQGIDIRDWWRDFLKGQLGQGPSYLPPNAKYFKGSEMLPNKYDGWTTAAVLAAYYWSVRVDPSHVRAADIRSLAPRYLRATWYMYALAAASDKARISYSNNSFLTTELPNGSPIALASPRARESGFDGRMRLFARVAGFAEIGWEPPAQRQLVDWLRDHWSGVFGINSTMKNYLRRAVIYNELPANLRAVMSGIKMKRTLHFLLWDGIRLTYLEPNSGNTNHRVMFAMAYYRDPFFYSRGRELHMLSPWHHDSNINPGSLTVDAANNRLIATGHFQAEMTVPATAPLHHVKIGPGGLVFCPKTLACN